MRHPYRDLHGLLVLPAALAAVLVAAAGFAGFTLPTIGAPLP